MKRYMLLLLLSSSYLLSAKQLTYTVEEVEIDTRIVQFIGAFIEYEKGCDFWDNSYPQDNILSFYMRRSPKGINDSEELRLVLEFYPDFISCHKYEDIKYISHIQIEDSTYNVYIIMDDANELSKENKQHYLPLKLTGNHETITKKGDPPYGEYDPPFIRIWYITNEFDRNGIYVEHGFSNYCW